MSSNPYADQLALTRTGLVTVGGFVLMQGDLAPADEPSTADSYFEVTGDEAPGLTQGMMQPVAMRQAKRGFSVTYLVDSKHDRIALENTISQRDEAIIVSLESGPFYAPGVQFIVCTGGSIIGDGDFWRRTLKFDCTYVFSLS